MSELLVLLLAGGLAMLVAPWVSRSSQTVRFLLLAYSLAVLTRYFIWRIVKLPPWELSAYVLLAYAFFAIESVATYLAFEDFTLLRRTADRSVDVAQTLDWYAERPPRVDVLIATYNESWEVLEKTIVGATSQNYGNYHVWILDDGNRAWLRDKAAACNVGYVTRTNNAHYKAGNLNNGIAQLRARGVELEFIALLDADFIAWPEFLRRTTALMKSPDIGIVQTPQCFYNPDPHQLAFGGVKRWPDEQRGWFDVYLPSLDALGWATCCGTSCLIRRAALDAIGGFPTQSVCEDTLTSIRMGEKGWKTAFLSERLTVGLAPEGIGEFLTQRARWLLGGVQNARACGAEPGIGGRLRYWANLWRLGIWGIMPPLWVSLTIAIWFTGVSLIPIDNLAEAISYFGPLWLLRIFQGWLFGGRQQAFVSDAIWMLLAPLWVFGTLRAVLGADFRFKVTDKAQHRDRRVIHWGLLRFHGVLAVGLLAGALYALTDSSSPTHHNGFFQANTVMTIWFLLVMIAGLAPAIEPPKRRTSERYPSSESVAVMAGERRLTWRCKDISLGGISVYTSNVESPPREVVLSLSGVRPIHAKLIRTPAPNLAVFAFDDPAVRPELIRKLYCSDAYIPQPQRWGLTRSLSSFVRWLCY